MVPVKNGKLLNLLPAVPVLLSAAGGILHSWPLMILGAAAVPPAVLLSPLCRGYENMWSFLLTFFVMPAPGISLMLLARDNLGLWMQDTVTWISCGVMMYFGLLGVLEILLGLPVRVFRPHQHGFLKDKKH